MCGDFSKITAPVTFSPYPLTLNESKYIGLVPLQCKYKKALCLYTGNNSKSALCLYLSQQNKKTQVSRPCAFTINQLCASFMKRVDYFQSLSREARLITPIGEKPRAIATTLEVTVTYRPQRTSTSYSEVISQNKLREQTREQPNWQRENGINRNRLPRRSKTYSKTAKYACLEQTLP